MRFSSVKRTFLFSAECVARSESDEAQGAAAAKVRVFFFSRAP